MAVESRIENRIRELRLDREGLTQQALADAIGVSRQTLNAIEGAKYSPSLEVAFRIADVLGVPLTEVFQHVPLRPKLKTNRRGRR